MTAEEIDNNVDGHEAPGARGRPSKYPWQEWADGQGRWVNPAAYDVTCKTLQMAVHMHARQNGMVAKTRSGDAVKDRYPGHEGQLWFRFHKA